MRTSLPNDFSSTIVVRHDRTQPYYLKAMIFGPDDTPYASGAFCFDIFCPPSYPSVAPLVNLVTTGGGTVRFSKLCARE